MTDWKPGDVANGHVLGDDNVWRPVETGAGPPPPPPVSPPGKRAWFKRWWGIVLIALGGLLGIWIIAGMLNSDLENAEEALGMNDEFWTIGCQDLTREAVRIASENADESSLTLTKVRGPRVVTDNRKTYELPQGEGEVVVLACEGTAVWSDDSTDPVRVIGLVESDGRLWVEYEPVN